MRIRDLMVATLTETHIRVLSGPWYQSFSEILRIGLHLSTCILGLLVRHVLCPVLVQSGSRGSYNL